MSQDIAVTTDAAIFCRKGETTRILLVQRKGDPFQGKWALPGGFLEEKEPLETGAKRELQEETGLVIDQLHQLRAFGTPGRDPRGRTITIAFWGEAFQAEQVSGGDDAADARWFPLKDLPELAFDHKEIIHHASGRFFGEKGINSPI